MIKYAICPGPIRSSSDGQWHHIRASDLIKLYGVKPAECLILDWNNPERLRGLDIDHLIRLCPRLDGNYTLEEGRH